MKLVLFDLGDTLESEGVLLPEALDTLEAVDALGAGARPAVLLGLVSDVDVPDQPSDVQAARQRCCRLLDHLGIRSYFEPVAERVTLSAEAGVPAPHEELLRAATAKIDPPPEFHDVLFITGSPDHALAARGLGLSAVHVRGPGQPHGEVASLSELVPMVHAFADGEDPVETVVLEAPPDAQRPVVNRVAAAEATWTRLGDVLVGQAPTSRVGQVLADAQVARSARRSFVPEQRLHLVVQTARLFQEDHPDVPVVVDKGRYLVVDLDPAAASRVEGPHAADYDVRPLPSGSVVFDQRTARPRDTGAPVEEAGGPAGGLSRAAFEEDLGTLARLRTRHSASAEFLGALEWARGRLSDLGCATHVQTVTVGSWTSRNLVADRPGHGDEKDLVLVTAHLDSVNVQGPEAAAPGADDNASGSAGVLAIGRALAGCPARNDLRLVLFGGEEQGLFGSRQYVSGLEASERARIRAVINMDMIACRNTDRPAVLLEGAAESQAVMDVLADIAEAHTSLAVQTSLNPFNSDHVPFLERGIPAVLTIEGTDSANDDVHTERDTLDTLDIDLALEILRMNVLFVAQALDGDTRLRGSNN